MNRKLSLLFDARKFLWDGRVYETAEEAARIHQSYRNDGFEVRTIEDNGKFLLYSRRMVKEASSAS